MTMQCQTKKTTETETTKV